MISTVGEQALGHVLPHTNNSCRLWLSQNKTFHLDLYVVRRDRTRSIFVIVSAKLFSFLPTQILWIQFEVYVKTYLRISLCITSPDHTPPHRHCIVEVYLYHELLRSEFFNFGVSLLLGSYLNVGQLLIKWDI